MHYLLLGCLRRRVPRGWRQHQHIERSGVAYRNAGVCPSFSRATGHPDRCGDQSRYGIDLLQFEFEAAVINANTAFPTRQAIVVDQLLTPAMK